MRLTSFLVIGLSAWLIAACDGSAVTESLDNLTEERLRARIALAWSHFINRNFDEYVAIASARHRPALRESDEDWQKSMQMWESILREKPTFEIDELQITSRTARVKMKVSTLEDKGSRVTEIQYDYWVFENGDWFLDDFGRTE